MGKLKALGCAAIAGIAAALVVPLFTATAAPPAKPSPTPTPTPTVAPYTPAYQVVEASRELPVGAVNVRAQCSSGKSVTGGGYSYDGNGVGHVVVYESYPEPVTQSWMVSTTLDPSAPGPVTLKVYAVCANTQ